MLTREENELLTRTGPGTSMGQVVRRYWLPALLSSEIAEPAGPPVRVELLSESFVAFRDTEGKVGLLDEACPHRGASLVLARNEDAGLRCIYHGWQFDTEGNCLDMPSEPADSRFAHKVRQRSFPVREVNGVIWAYLGPREQMPPFREFIFMTVPASHGFAMKVLQTCNYLQGIEGGIDSAHISFLHRDTRFWLKKEDSQVDEEEQSVRDFVGQEVNGILFKDVSPRLYIDPTKYGFRYGAVRLAEGHQYVRITPFIMPWHTYVPGGPRKAFFHAWVPRDDYSVWTWDFHYKLDSPMPDEEKQEDVNNRGLWLDNRFRSARSRENNWQQDRAAMHTRSFTGIAGIANQDQGVQESMGAIFDRTKEHLGTSDRAVIAMRRMLLETAKALVDEGEDPPGLEALPYELIMSEAFVIPEDKSWTDHSRLNPQLTGHADKAIR